LDVKERRVKLKKEEKSFIYPWVSKGGGVDFDGGLDDSQNLQEKNESKQGEGLHASSREP